MDFLQDVKMNNVIPADATIKEGALYVIEHGEAEFNKMLEEQKQMEQNSIDSLDDIDTDTDDMNNITSDIDKDINTGDIDE